MAIKFFCDGCDDEIRAKGENNDVAIKVGRGSDGEKTYQLCDSCVRYHMYPQTWPRAPKEGPKL